MPFLTQQRLAGHQINTNFNVPATIFQPEYARQVVEGWINLSQLQLNPDVGGRELLFSLETAGDLIGDEIYWLQVETLWNDRVVWRGEVGVFYDESIPNIRFMGSIPVQTTSIWSPEQPNLYELHLSLFRGTRLLDRVETFFGLRQDASENGQLYLVNHYGWKTAGEITPKI